MRKVLVIEDEERVREVLVRFLDKKGLAVVSAASGAEGLEAARREIPDVVLLDKSLPDSSGFEVLEQIKAIVPSAKVFLLSGFSSEDLQEEARRRGAEGFLDKIAGIEEVARALDKVLGDAAEGP